MADSYFDSSLTAQQIENVLSGVHSVTGVVQRNGDGTFSAATVYPMLNGASAPTTATIGYVNQLYRCGTALYVCTAADGVTYTWELVSGGGGASVSTATCTLTVAGWSNNTQSASVTGVTSTNTVAICPAPEGLLAYEASKIILVGQGNGSLAFNCTTVPETAIVINVMIFG